MSTVSSSVIPTVTAGGFGINTDNIKINEDFWQYQEDVRNSMIAAFSPLNITIILSILTLLYFRYRSSPTDVTIEPNKPITFSTFTPRTLLKYNGLKSTLNPNSSVYIAVQGKVYDVSPGRNFYGPGGPYENFAGRDATRGLACQSFDEEMLTKNLDGPLDKCEDLDGEQRENLKGWVERFDEKYLVVGKLIAYNEGRSEF